MIFVIIALTVAYYGISGVAASGVWRWYNYIAVYFFGPLAFVLSVRTLIKFKVVNIGKEMIEIWYPFRFSKKKYQVKEVVSWKEETVKTGRSLFRELVVRFEKHKLKLSNQENSSYDQVITYMKKKAKNKQL